MLKVREVLEQFGVEPSAIHRVRRGRNTHWIVATSGERVVLRRYAASCSLREVEYELRLLEHLSGKGWPVADPLAPPRTIDREIWCVFRYIGGRGPSYRTAEGATAEQRRRGLLLARLHHDMPDHDTFGQREGWRRTDEGLFDRAGKLPAEVVLRAYEQRQPDEGRFLRGYADRTRERLAELTPLAPDPILIHGDFAPWNMRYVAGELSGVFDFDNAHLDLRVADFALSWRGRHEGVIDGYEQESPLAPIDRELLVPVYWAWLIASAVIAIEEGNAPDWAIAHLRRQPEETR